MNVSKFIHDRRLELHLTLEDIAQAVGVQKQTVMKWEKGMIKNIGSTRLSALAAVLQITPDMLIDPRYIDREHANNYFAQRAEVQEDFDSAWQIRERLRRDPDFRLLFDAAGKATPEHLRAAAAMLKALEPPKENDNGC